MIIRYSRIALAELDLIYTHIELDNAIAADDVKRRIQATIDKLNSVSDYGEGDRETAGRV